MLFLTSFIVAAASAHALPRSASPPATYLIPANGTLTPYAPERPANTFSIQAEEGSTDLEVGDKTVVAQDLSASEGEHPQAFTQLWDWVENEACTLQGCYFGQEFCVTAAEGQDICISVNGQFSPSQRDGYLMSARGAFDRSVETVYPPRGVIESGTNFVDIRANTGMYGGGGVRVQLRNVSTTGDGSCPAIISVIAAGGAIFPQIAAGFGALTFTCNAVALFTGTATG